MDEAGAPLQGAEVVVRWEARYPYSISESSGMACVYLQGARTDAAGRFVVPPWSADRGVATIAYAVVNAYKRGLEPDAAGETRALANELRSSPVRIKLRPAPPAVEPRLAALHGYDVRVPCDQGGASRRNAMAFAEAVNVELKALIATPEGQAIRAREAPLRARLEKGEWLGDVRLIAVDNDASIAALSKAHEGELLEKVEARKDSTPTTVVSTPAARPQAKGLILPLPPQPGRPASK